MKASVWISALTWLATVPTSALEPADDARLDAVTERGRQVMPFDLEKTTHVFTKTALGGRQRVLAKNPADGEQVQRIRAHLAQLAEALSRGDFSWPERIHGADMPGLAALRGAQPGQIEYRYQALPDGAQIDYVTGDAGLIEAIHRYFEAQLHDHARHALPGHEQHRIPEK
ncbi:aspartate carbamoyltransferase [Candidatus Methylocalor cossyra]|uniref:Aspartate carbamoyltransferase n=1 Tax=Candidatus Methylocalor cossyra TaxID=3108543 RepID=A0ABP1C7G3_9GAMM